MYIHVHTCTAASFVFFCCSCLFTSGSIAGVGGAAGDEAAGEAAAGEEAAVEEAVRAAVPRAAYAPRRHTMRSVSMCFFFLSHV